MLIRLSHPDEIEFRVIRHAKWFGYYTTPPRAITINEARHYHLDSMVATMHHEVLHLDQEIRKTESTKTEHNLEFRMLARRACEEYGWDYGNFLGSHGAYVEKGKR